MTSQGAKSSSPEIFAILGAVFWALQLLGQLWSNFGRKSTKGLQTFMMLIWAGTGNVLALHNHLSHQSIALVVQAELLFGLSLLTWIQTLRYTRLWPMTWCAGTLIAFSVLSGGVQAAFIIGIQALEPSSKARQALRIVTATLSTLGLSVGVLQHYLEIFRNQSIEGISWSYVSIDALGDLCSLLAVVRLRPFDPATLTIYASELALWTGIILLGLGLNLPTLIRRDFFRRLGADIEAEIIPGSAYDLPAVSTTPQVQRPVFQGGSIFSTARSTSTSHTELSTYEFRRRVLAQAQNSLETL